MTIKPVILLPILIIPFYLLTPCSVPVFAQEQKEYYPNGQIKTSWVTAPDTGDIHFKEYYKDERLKNEGTYRNGRLEGPYKKYFFSQKLSYELNFKNGEPDGPYREYHESGGIKKEGRYRNGKMEGLQKLYDEKHHLQEEVNFVEDVPQGRAKTYYRDGTLRQELQYHQGKYHGLFKEYYDNGQVKLILTYNEDEREGPYRVFYDHGAIWEMGTLQGGKPEGVVRTFFPSGILQKEDTYSKGVLNGMSKEFRESGILKRIDVFAGGEKVRTMRFNDRGKLLATPKILWGVLPLPEITKDQCLLSAIFFLCGMAATWLASRRFCAGRIALPRVLAASRQDKASSRGGRDKELNPLHGESGKMYRHLIETMDNGIFMADPQGKIFYANHAFVEKFGFQTKDDVVGLSLNKELFADNDEEEDFLDKLSRLNRVEDYKFRWRKKESGETLVVSASANYFRDEKGDVTGVEGVIFDVTEKARMEEDLLVGKRKLEHLLGFFEGIDALRGMDDLAPFVVRGVTEILEAKRCSLMLVDEKTNALFIREAQGINAELIRSVRVAVGDPIAGVVAREREPLLVRNIEYDERFRRAKRPDYLGRSFMIVPLLLDEKLIGILNVADKDSEMVWGEPFNETDLRLLVTIATKVAVAIDNVELFSELNILTVTDPMTQIYNYRLLSESLDHEISRFKRSEGDLCVILLDIDHFKTYNDTFGHLEGDELLKRFSGILKSQLRESDIICRYAGDEFCIVLPDTNPEGARNAAEKIRRTVEEAPFKRVVTISVGIAQYRKGMSKKELLASADAALYQAKNEGRNRVVICPADNSQDTA